MIVSRMKSSKISSKGVGSGDFSMHRAAYQGKYLRARATTLGGANFEMSPRCMTISRTKVDEMKARSPEAGNMTISTSGITMRYMPDSDIS